LSPETIGSRVTSYIETNDEREREKERAVGKEEKMSKRAKGCMDEMERRARVFSQKTRSSLLGSKGRESVTRGLLK
jgi:hypothetical protein